ncbi:MAG: hypothetical protein JWM10_504 [Myxococcaceae bacterium]|nr:hypothetical protein [Myxococcaceae bacterium]
MTNAARRAPDDDDLLPELAPLDTDEAMVDVPDEMISGDLDEGLGDDDELAGVDPRAAVVMVFLDDAAGEDDEGTPDDPIDALPDDERGGWVGDDERPGDDVAEFDEPARDHPDAGEDGPTRDPYDEVDTALPALDDGDDDEGPDEAASP